jgi:hypothetical protein
MQTQTKRNAYSAVRKALTKSERRSQAEAPERALTAARVPRARRAALDPGAPALSSSSSSSSTPPSSSSVLLSLKEICNTCHTEKKMRMKKNVRWSGRRRHGTSPFGKCRIPAASLSPRAAAHPFLRLEDQIKDLPQYVKRDVVGADSLGLGLGMGAGRGGGPGKRDLRLRGGGGAGRAGGNRFWRVSLRLGDLLLT